MTTYIINTMICLGFCLKNIETDYISFSKRDKKSFTFIKVNTDDDILITCICFNFDTDYIKTKSIIVSRSSIDFNNQIIDILKFINCFVGDQSSFSI